MNHPLAACGVSERGKTVIIDVLQGVITYSFNEPDSLTALNGYVVGARFSSTILDRNT